MSGHARKEHEIPPGLLRQRRNLLLACLAIVVVNLGEFKFTQLNLIGLVAEIENPDVVKKTLGLLWFYALLRYWQYFYDSELGLRHRWYAHVSVSIQKVIDKSNYDVRGGTVYNSVGYSGSAGFHLKTPDSSSELSRPEFRITAHQAISIYVCAINRFVINSPLATDYLLPFLIAGSAGVYVFFF